MKFDLYEIWYDVGGGIKQTSNFFWCLLDTFLNFVPSFMKIWLHLPEIWGFVFHPKLRARFHVLCVHARMCMRTNTFNQLRRPILRYAEDFVKIWLHLTALWWFEKSVTFVTHTQTRAAQFYYRWTKEKKKFVSGGNFSGIQLWFFRATEPPLEPGIFRAALGFITKDSWWLNLKPSAAPAESHMIHEQTSS